MSDEEHLERLQQAVLKWHEWQAANRPPFADLESVGEVSRSGPTSDRFPEKPHGLLARVIGTRRRSAGWWKRMVRPHSLVRLSQVIGSACVVVLIVLSVLPANERPHTGFPGQIEHAAAYFGTAVFLAFGYRTTTGRIATIALLVGLAAALEMIQLLVPGATRSSSTGTRVLSERDLAS
jgi:hypothetical protein